MKKSKQILTVLFLAVLVISTLCVPAFALDESEVEAAVAASGKEAVTGNVLIRHDGCGRRTWGWRWPGRFRCWKCGGQVRLLRDDRVLQGRPDWNGRPAYH